MYPFRLCSSAAVPLHYALLFASTHARPTTRNESFFGTCVISQSKRKILRRINDVFINRNFHDHSSHMCSPRAIFFMNQAFSNLKSVLIFQRLHYCDDLKKKKKKGLIIVLLYEKGVSGQVRSGFFCYERNPNCNITLISSP